MPRVFFTADSHFGHEAIIAHCARPFGSVQEMDRAMVDIWNSVVTRHDVVWHLGDFWCGRSADSAEAAKVFRKLHGQKHLVTGNHDGSAVQALPWASVRQIADIAVERQRLVLCHYPMRSWAGSVHGAIHLHGHEHGRMPPWPSAMDVGVDAWTFLPVSLEQVRERMAEST